MNTSDHHAAQRRSMIVEQLESRGITSTRVLQAMQRVPRHRFVASAEEADAYADQALPIDCGQTISQPYIVALMSEGLELSGSEHVLEVGTGSGYQTAVLADLAGDVVTVERHRLLSQQAQQRLADLGYRNVQCVVGDGSRGWPAAAPYDRIIVTAAADVCPPDLIAQLADGGILIGPFGPPSGQLLQAIHKHGNRLDTSNLTACRFVPLIGDE